MKKVVCLVILLIAAFCSAYAANYDGETDLPDYVELLNNGKEDVFYTHIMAITRHYNYTVPNPELVDDVKSTEYFQATADFLDRLCQIYMEDYQTVSDMGRLYLEYLDWLSVYIASLDNPRILENGEVLFVLPDLQEPFYTYMPIRAITSTTSRQWAFKPHLTTDDETFKRYGEAYGIALGTYFGTTIGDVYRIDFENGQQILGVLTDVKSDLHTDPSNRYADADYLFNGVRGNVLEFVMDDEHENYIGMDYYTKVNAINQVINHKFPSKVISITKVGKVDAVF